MDTIILQEKIESLLNSARMLLPDGSNIKYVYVDDLSRLNKNIHNQINELYAQRGENTEQEAALCIAILMGYSVSIYANPEDESKKQIILRRSQMLLESLSPSPLKQQLFSAYSMLE